MEDLLKLLEMLRKETKGAVNQILLEDSRFNAKVGDQGRVTLPSPEKRELGIEKGDLV